MPATKEVGGTGLISEESRWMGNDGSSLETFRSWYEAHRHRFAIPLRKIGEREWEFTVTEWLVVTLVRDSLMITARHLTDPDDRWDELAEFDAIPLETEAGWICRLCRDLPAPGSGPPQIYRSREALLIDHVFEPFVTWVNDTLAQSEALGLYEIGDGFQWAKLLSDQPDAEAKHLKRRIPLK